MQILACHLTQLDCSRVQSFLGIGLYLSASTIKMYSRYSAHPVLHTCTKPSQNRSVKRFLTDVKVAFTTDVLSLNVGSKKLASSQSHLACMIYLQLFMQLGIVVTTRLWAGYLIQFDHFCENIKQLSKKSATTLFIKAYVVCIYYLSYTIQQSFRAFGRVHPLYEMPMILINAYSTCIPLFLQTSFSIQKNLNMSEHQNLRKYCLN